MSTNDFFELWIVAVDTIQTPTEFLVKFLKLGEVQTCPKVECSYNDGCKSVFPRASNANDFKPLSKSKVLNWLRDEPGKVFSAPFCDDVKASCKRSAVSAKKNADEEWIFEKLGVLPTISEFINKIISQKGPHI